MSETLFLLSGDILMSGILANESSCKGLEKTTKFLAQYCGGILTLHMVILLLKLSQFTVCGTLDISVYHDRRLPGKSRLLRKSMTCWRVFLE